MANKLLVQHDSELEFPDRSLIGKGSFSECHRCWLKSDPSQQTLAVKIVKLYPRDGALTKWTVEHTSKEVGTIFKLCQDSDAFVKVFSLYIRHGMFAGYTMEYCKYGSVRKFSSTLASLAFRHDQILWLTANWTKQVANGLDYLSAQHSRVIVHRDIAVDNVLIDDCLNAKIADLGMHKGGNSIATQLTLQLGKAQGIERRPPETFDDPLRQPDEFVDRYQYGVFVVEAFCRMSIRPDDAEVDAFKAMVKAGQHLARFARLLDERCFDRLLLSEWTQRLERLHKTVQEVAQLTLQPVPERRTTFAEVIDLWQRFDQGSMEAERLQVLSELAKPDRTAGCARETSESTGSSFTVSVRTNSSTQRETNVVQSSPKIPEVHDESVGEASGAERRHPVETHFRSTHGLTISVGAVIGDMHSFQQPEGPDGASVSVSQKVPQMRGDEVELLQRMYAEFVADEALQLRLCRCSEVAACWWVVLKELGCTEVDMNRLQQRCGASASDGDKLMQELRRLAREHHLTVSELGEAFKKSGCIAGLRILREWEQEFDTQGIEETLP